MSRLLTGRGLAVEPLPADRQPGQDDPTILPAGARGAEAPPDGVAPGDLGMQLPAFQLLDRTTGLWVEFPQPTSGREMRIASPERYVDETGALRVRFVNRVADSGMYFSISARLEGTL
jgi:hypothetical protein